MAYFYFMTISTITSVLEKVAPLSLQEDYDNAGLIIGDGQLNCSGVLLTLDVTEEVVEEAISAGCNLIIAHHPIIFKGLKKINGNNYVEKTVLKAIRNNVAIYACHTNIDNVLNGVNAVIANRLGLINRRILLPKSNQLLKLAVYVPETHAESLLNALFNAGAGNIGNYSECSFVSEGTGSFKPGIEANPYAGQIGIRETTQEKKIEVVFPFWLQSAVLKAMKENHPYEEVAFDLFNLKNSFQDVGAGLLGELPTEVDESFFLEQLTKIFGLAVVKHTPFLGKMIKKVAVCGGSGSFLTSAAIKAGADVYLTSDIKYHEFFDANNSILLADIGHFESEQYTIELFDAILRQNFPNFALLKSKVNTNPVRYFISH